MIKLLMSLDISSMVINFDIRTQKKEAKKEKQFVDSFVLYKEL